MDQSEQTILGRRDLENFFLNSNIDINFSNFFIGILLSLFLSYIVKFTYVKAGRALNDKDYFSDTFIPLAIITTLVITVIKFSLALSLGLVGALSIVRFRAAIKEPEELVYLFLIIAVGLGCGANQLIITFVGIFFSLATILVYSKYLKSSNTSFNQIINMGIIIDENISDIQINNLIENLIKDTAELKFISMSRNNINTTINIELIPNEFKDLIEITGKIKEAYPNSKTILAQNTDLSL